MFSAITEMLDKSVSVTKLKRFLAYYCHPLYPRQKYIDSKLYENAERTEKLLDSLFPQFINYIDFYLLEDIVEEFGCEDSRKLMGEYKSMFD